MTALGTSTTSIDEPTLEQWSMSDASMRAEAVAQGRVWHLRVNRREVWHLLVTARGAPRRFQSLETLARRLLELNIVDLEVIRPPTPSPLSARNTASLSPRSNADHSCEPSTWDDWFKEQIQISLRDKRPGTDYRQVWREADERIRKIGGLHARPKKS
ncbi:hypothetical protein [Roseateles sp.]|uniref:hypothetical protein n=1 Tax=Roseateles sp. TaxID=1971397 RepID=UPI0031D8FAFB